MAFAGEQAGGGIEADPARAGDVDLCPRMQVGEVRAGIGRRIVWPKLDQVARHEAGGEADAAQHLDQQPARIAA